MTDIASKPVTAVARGTAEEELFLGELIAAGLLVPGGVEGLFGHGAEFEHLVLQFDRFVTKRGADEHATMVRFPPLISKQHYERTDHLRSFPNLVGCVHSFSGGDGEHAALLSAVESGGEWSQFFDASDLVFTPAACYPVYPMATGAIGPDGLTYDVFSYCFRHEPSRVPRGCNCSACASTCASARRSSASPSATSGRDAHTRCFTRWACPAISSSPTIPFSVAPAGCWWPISVIRN